MLNNVQMCPIFTDLGVAEIKGEIRTKGLDKLSGFQKGACIRFSITPVAVDRVVLRAFIHPRSLQTLADTAITEKRDMNSPGIPAIQLRFGNDICLKAR